MFTTFEGKRIELNTLVLLIPAAIRFSVDEVAVNGMYMISEVGLTTGLNDTATAEIAYPPTFRAIVFINEQHRKCFASVL